MTDSALGTTRIGTSRRMASDADIAQTAQRQAPAARPTRSKEKLLAEGNQQTRDGQQDGKTESPRVATIGTSG